MEPGYMFCCNVCFGLVNWNATNDICQFKAFLSEFSSVFVEFDGKGAFLHISYHNNHRHHYCWFEWSFSPGLPSVLKSIRSFQVHILLLIHPISPWLFLFNINQTLMSEYTHSLFPDFLFFRKKKKQFACEHFPAHHSRWSEKRNNNPNWNSSINAKVKAKYRLIFHIHTHHTHTTSASIYSHTYNLSYVFPIRSFPYNWIRITSRSTGMHSENWVTTTVYSIIPQHTLTCY